MQKIEMNISGVHWFDPKPLSLYLNQQIADFGRIIQIGQIQGGVSNPTLSIVAEARGHQQRYIVRKKPPGNLLPSAHQVDREYRVIKALAQTDVPVPEALHYCGDRGVIGTEFYVMRFLDGRIFRNARLPELNPTERTAVYEDLNRVLAQLHGVDIAAVGLNDFGRSNNYFERQIARWSSQYRNSETEKCVAMETLIAELPGAIPADDSVAIAHGDYRLENVMFDPIEPRIIAVLDWELSTIGHPLADLAYNCFLWHSHNKAWGTLDGLDLVGSGIPSESDYIAEYCRRTKRENIDHWGFYMAFAIFRLAAIVQGVYKRSLQGNLSASHVVENETNALAEQALNLLRGG